MYYFIYFNLDEKKFRMLILWLEENILHTLKPEKRFELQNIDSSTWNTAFKNYCVSCCSPIKSTDTVDQLEWLLGKAVRKSYNEQSKLELIIAFFQKCFFKLIILLFVII